MSRKAVLSRARELAASGVHISTLTIVLALEAEGFAKARDFLSDPLIRADLNNTCAKCWNEPRVVVDIEKTDGAPQEQQKPAR